MHLAICDDNIADRKQTERLLSRESDRRGASSGVLYVDSFGNREALLSAPMIYDGLFVDMTGNGSDALEIAASLRKAGHRLPIVFCCSRINYRQTEGLPENSFFLDKPIRAAELSAVCDALQAVRNSQEKKMEFRSDKEHFYLAEKEIMYAYPSDRVIRIRLTDGTWKEPVSDMISFGVILGFDTDTAIRGTTAIDLGYIRISESGLLAMIGCSSVINLSCVSRVGYFHVTMKDGKKLKILPSSRRRLQEAAARAH